MDAKDILGLPKTSLPIQEKKSRPQKDSQRKPDGISREVYALTGGLAPLMPAIDSSQLKKRPPSDEKITWQWLPFTSSARKDNLQLYHWVRVVNGVPPTGDYSFAKYNKSVDIVKYTDEEYEKYLTDSLWTKEETDQLFDLCERFDLRFIVIADRFPSSRTVEELKDRYYGVYRTLLIARAPSSAEVPMHPLVKEPYNVSQEIERKRALSMYLSQTKQQERKDQEVLAEAKRITESRMPAKVAEESEVPAASNAGAEATEKAISGDPLSSVQLPSSVVPSTTAVDNASTLPSLRMLRVYLRTYALDQMVQAASSSAGLRTIKRVEQTLQEVGVNLKPRVPTKAVCAEHLELRKEILTLLNLQKQLHYKEAEGRDGSYTETPGTPKVRKLVFLGHTSPIHLFHCVDFLIVQAHNSSSKPSISDSEHTETVKIMLGDQDRTFIPDSLSLGGERVGRRDQKRKAPGRISEATSSPAQSKRPRKLKASDL